LGEIEQVSCGSNFCIALGKTVTCVNDKIAVVEKENSRSVSPQILAKKSSRGKSFER